MIHVATIHNETDKWINIQLNYLKKFIQVPYRIYAFLSEVSPKYSNDFFYYSTEPITNHGIKLNILFDIISFYSKDLNDIVIFLDGDAFPIAALDTYIYDKFEHYELMAIQRRENKLKNKPFEEKPHPSFCATTIGFWKKIKGDWGEELENDEMKKDVGVKLHEILKEHEINWYPLLRTNKRDLHTILFGVYDNVIYHHGAGFQDAYTSNELLNLCLLPNNVYLNKLFKTVINNVIEKLSKKYIIHVNNRKSMEVYSDILKNEKFYEFFMK